MLKLNEITYLMLGCRQRLHDQDLPLVRQTFTVNVFIKTYVTAPKLQLIDILCPRNGIAISATGGKIVVYFKFRMSTRRDDINCYPVSNIVYKGMKYLRQYLHCIGLKWNKIPL